MAGDRRLATIAAAPGRGGCHVGRLVGRRPVRLTPEDIRQLRSEARQYANDAQDLRGVLRGESIDPKELDEILERAAQLEDERVYQDVEELARLQAFVAEGLKRFEFGLRRKVDGDDRRRSCSVRIRRSARRSSGSSSSSTTGRSGPSVRR